MGPCGSCVKQRLDLTMRHGVAPKPSEVQSGVRAGDGLLPELIVL